MPASRLHSLAARLLRFLIPTDISMMLTESSLTASRTSRKSEEQESASMLRLYLQLSILQTPTDQRVSGQSLATSLFLALHRMSLTLILQRSLLQTVSR